MIENSIKNAQAGMGLAQGAAEELSHVVDGIKEVVALTSDISHSCKEQSIGMEQISAAALQISNVIQSNTATSQEAAAASQELAGQAELMLGEVSQFKSSKRYESSYETGYSEKPYVNQDKRKVHIGDTEFGKY